MKMMSKVKMLSVTFRGNQIHPTLIYDDNDVILVDAGFPGQLKEIREAMNRVGIELAKLSKVIITHQDFDHIGGLPEILKASDHKIEVFAHKEEKPYIEGVRPLQKMTPERLAKMFVDLSEDTRKEAENKFLESLQSHVDQTVEGGEVLPYCGGITIIYTPGHTPGHICLYLSRDKILIAGDALNVVNGQLIGPNPGFTHDMAAARKSVESLSQLDVATVICYHGGTFDNHVNERLKEIAFNF